MKKNKKANYDTIALYKAQNNAIQHAKNITRISRGIYLISSITLVSCQ